MKLQDYTTTRLSDYLINLTAEPVSVYEESSGAIRTYPPQHLPLPSFRHQKVNEMIFHYIVSRRTLRKAQQEQRPLDDLVVVSDSSYGRGGVLISRLIWGTNFGVKVCVVPNVGSSTTDHL